MTTTERILNKSIELSTAAKNYNGAASTYFKTELVDVRKLAIYLTLHNYSAIHWRDGSRKESNFIKAVAYIGDYDDNRTIQEVHDDLVSRGINHLIIPSKSHTPEHHKFHVVIFFSSPVYTATGYKKIAAYIANEILPGSDTAVTDAARFIFGSPEGADAICYFDGEDFNPAKHEKLWNQNTEIRDKDGNVISPIDVSQETPIYCPFHDDSKPSAFINHSKKRDNWFIHCKSCDETYWMETDITHLERVCENYYSYGTDVYDFGMMDDEFFYNKLGSRKFHVLTGTDNEPEKAEAFRYLVKRHHIRHLRRIDYISDMDVDESFYAVDLGSGVITAHHRGIPVDIEDNEFIEAYLKDRFGKYLTFIKEWIAVYCYTNYKKLPTIIFNSDRGNGKSSFVEIIAEIFPTLSFQWGGNEDGFTYEVEKKFLTVEENQSEKVSQYKTLKKYTGQKHATVKKKFKDPYQVKNNMNIIILSNDAIPLFVSRGELPTDTKNNQFFVYEFPEITGAIDPDLQEKILARLGHYIRTELKTVFDGLSTSGFRYSIDVPITDAEKELFAANTTDLESDVDVLIDRLTRQYDEESFPQDEPFYAFIKEGYLPVQWIKNYTNGTRHYNQITKAMRRQRLVVGDAVRKTVAKNTVFALTMTDSLSSKLKQGKKENNLVGNVGSLVGDLFN
jgi:hypothetical protein